MKIMMSSFSLYLMQRKAHTLEQTDCKHFLMRHSQQLKMLETRNSAIHAMHKTSNDPLVFRTQSFSQKNNNDTCDLR